MDKPPNLTERLENLVACLDEAKTAIFKLGVVEGGFTERAQNALDDADGIAGELLTMINGR